MKLTEAHDLARTLMDEHGLDDWTFQFDKSVRRFGCTHYSLKRITLSSALVELNEKPRVTNTILHEIAHALTPKDKGHGIAWKMMARSIGCDAKRVYDGSLVAQPKHKWTGTCPSGHETFRHRRTKGLACGRCCRENNNNRWSAEYLFEWSEYEPV